MADLIPLVGPELESVTRAIDLIDDAGWPEKAKLLRDFLRDGKMGINVELFDLTTVAICRGKRSIEFNGRRADNALLKSRPPRAFTRKDPELVLLASTLMHEADHALCHGEIEAYGEEITFIRTILERIARLFPDASAEERRKIADQANETKANAERQRDKQVDQEPPPPTQPRPKGKIKIELRSERGVGGMILELVPADLPDYPAPLGGPVDRQLGELAGGLFTYRDCHGSFPEGDNAAMVRALRELDRCAVRADDLDKEGRVVDPWGRPYVYRSPGRIFPREFDLYSLGPRGDDQGGEGDNILCELHRR